MSSPARSWSLALVVVVGVSAGVVACIDAPRMGVMGTESDVTGTDPSAGGGASTVSRERDGMILVPAMTIDGGVATAGKEDAPGQIKKDAGGGPGNGSSGGPGNGSSGGGPGNGSSGGPGNGSSGGPGNGSSGGPGNGSSGGSSGEPAPAQPGVAVPSFWLDAREVTVDAYRQCLGVNACTAPAALPGCTLEAGLGSHPVTCVTADQARAFCTWSNKRLVRNDEVTAAAAGNAQRVYPWGSDLPAADRLNACGPECAATGMYGVSDGHAGTAPVGSFPLGRTPEGVEDLAGNVAEWVDGALTSIVRGGSYEDVDASLVTATSFRAAEGASPSIGFRCARDL